MDTSVVLNQSDRKAELERKKAKLAAIREEKRRKEEERRKQFAVDSSAADSVNSSSRSLREEADKILFELGLSTVADASTELDLLTSVSATDSISSESAAVLDSAKFGPLKVTEPVQISFSPRGQISYCKSTQTIVEHGEKDSAGIHMFEWDDEFGAAHHGRSPTASSPEEVLDMDSSPAHIIAGILPHVELIKPAEVPKEKKSSELNEQPLVEVPELTDGEKQNILSSDALQAFLARASVIVERAICQQDDIFLDYCKGVDQDKLDTSVKLSQSRCFYDETTMRGRCVMCIDHSLQFPELMAVSYDENQADRSNDPAGLVAVWNTRFKKNVPEYWFHAHSRILSLSWAKFHPNLLIGGTYCGQICLWDMRQTKRTPIQKSAMSTRAHSHPVYCLEVVGTANAHNIVTISSDGKMCSWSLEMLTEPQEVLDLQMKQTKPVGPYCMRFAPEDMNNFFLGSDDGCVYSACRHGSKAGITDTYEGHGGPTVGIDCHSAVNGSVDFSRLFLTSSFDWTVKLWNSKESKPLYSFENSSDYVFDVAWSPVHPALFACVDGTGKLDLWHLNQDTELPVASVIVDGQPALRKVSWPRSGTHVVVGADDGRTIAFDINEKLALPAPSEWNMLSKTLCELKQNQMETEELNAAAVLSSSSCRASSLAPGN